MQAITDSSFMPMLGVIALILLAVCAVAFFLDL